MIGAFILGHYKEREKNLPQIVKALKEGKVAPDKIYVCIDNPDLEFNDPSVVVIRSSEATPVIRKLGIALTTECDNAFFMDDDMITKPLTLETLVTYQSRYPNSILGFEGNILDTHSPNPYTHGYTVKSPPEPREVDILLRCYLAKTKLLAPALFLRENDKEQLGGNSLDDVLLGLGNKFLLKNINYVIPSDEFSLPGELEYKGTGLSQDQDHYAQRNRASYVILRNYEKTLIG